MMDVDKQPVAGDDLKPSSCDSSYTREEFIRRVVKGAAVTGGIFAAPKILDKFLIPPAYAQTSICSLPLGSATTSANNMPDTVVQTNPSEAYQISCDNNDLNNSTCVGSADFFGAGFNC